MKKGTPPPPTPPVPITLDAVGGGAAVELFDDAVKHVLENIGDPNTAWKPKRTIRLEFAFSVNEERNVGDLTVSCSTKLAGLVGISTLVYIGRHEGQLLAVEQPTQESLFPAPGGEVLSMVTGEPKK